MSTGGTVALLGRALAAALAPLSDALEPRAVDTLFADLGLGLPPQALADAGFGAALAAARSVAAGLPTLLEQLAAAISADDAAGTATTAAAVLGEVAVLRARLGDVGQAVRGLGPAFPTVPAAQLAAFATDLPAALIDLMVISRLELTAPGLVSGLAVAGLVDRRREPGVPGDPARPPFELRRLRVDRLPDVLGSPTTHLRNLYGWGAPGFGGGALLAQLADVAGHAGLPSLLTDAGGLPLLDLLVGTISADATGLRGELRFPVTAGRTVDLPLAAPGWRLRLSTAPALPAGLVASLTPPSSLSITGPPLTGAVRAQVAWVAPRPDRPLVVLGQAGSTRLQVASVTAAAEAVLAPAGGTSRAEPAIELAITGGQFVLDLGGACALLSALVPSDVLRAEFDLAIGISAGRVYLRGGAGLLATFPVHLSFGPAELLSIVVGLQPDAEGGIPVELSATITTMLGPLAMTVERIGLIARLAFPPGGGNLGPLDVSFGFKAPNGIGVALEAGPIQGGGYLSIDPAGRRFAGVLAFELTFIGVTAFGVYEVTPAGDTSFVAVLGIRFLPGIQLGFGFALTGLGGLVGFNRRADVDLLRERLASGAAGDVLFCDDPVANAPTLLGDLAALFPAAPGRFVIGPTFQIGWVAPIVRLDLAVLIELPGPTKIIVLGSVRVLIGVDETFALLFLRMDVLGILDFEQRLVSLDAFLVNSHALGVFRLTGGMAFRLSYGDNPYILLSVGGFHPRFDPGPLNLPAIPRVGAVLDIAVVARVYLRLELYVAFTSNTLQAGAKVEAGADLGPLSAHGYFTFDALIQFRPFAFDVEFSSGWSIEVFGESLCSVDVSGRITGPGPLVVRAHASVTLLFITVSGSATFELGSHDGDAPVPVPSIVRALEPELRDRRNLRADAGAADDAVVLRPGPAAVDGVLVGPRGQLVWEQKRAPLDTLVDRFEGAPLIGSHQLRLDPPAGWTVTPEHDWFSPGSFTSLDLRSSQTLNNATFQELPSGFRFASDGDATAPTPRPHVPTIDLIKRPTRTRFSSVAVGCYLGAAVSAALHERATGPAVTAGPPKVTVERESFAVLDAAGSVLTATETPFQAFQLTRRLPGSVAVPADDVVVVL